MMSPCLKDTKEFQEVLETLKKITKEADISIEENDKNADSD